MKAKSYCPTLRGLHLGSWNGKPAPIIGTGPSLLPQGHQLLDVLHLQQHLVLEELQVPMAVEGTGSPGCLPSPLGLLVLSSALALCGWQHGGKGRKNGNCPMARSRPVRSCLQNPYMNYLFWSHHDTLVFYSVQNPDFGINTDPESKNTFSQGEAL